MRMAIAEADRAAARGEVPVGCVIVKPVDNLPHAAWPVIGRAHNQVETLKDPTAHAEIIAITQAASAIGDWRLDNTILYCTKEPCVMCAGAIVAARIPIVVYGTADERRGGAVSVFGILNSPSLNHRCDVVSGVCRDECRAKLANFFRDLRAAAGPASASPFTASRQPERQEML